MLISKKELLKKTGISYGQLYRWKREGLIPEQWFIKQSSFTGQETFFPETKAIARIKDIKKLKNKYTLQEIIKLLEPKLSEKKYGVTVLESIEEIEHDLINIFTNNNEVDTFSFLEILIIVSISCMKEEFQIPTPHIEAMYQNIISSIEKMENSEYVMDLICIANKLYLTIYPEKSSILYDDRVELVTSIKLNDLSAYIEMKYKKILSI